MKSVSKNNIPKIHQVNIEQMNSLLPLLVNDNYLFLDLNGTIQRYSTNTEVFFNQIFNSKIIPGAPFFNQIIKDERIAHALESFLKKNLVDELTVVNIYPGGRKIALHINKVRFERKHIGYNCILDRTDFDNNQIKRVQLTNEFSELFSQTIIKGRELVNELHLNLLKNDEKFNLLESTLDKLKKNSIAILSAIETINTVITKASNSISILPRFPGVNVRNIMLLNDNELAHYIIKSMIKTKIPSMNVFSFTDTVEAIEFLGSHPTDIIFVDIELLRLCRWNFIEAFEKLELNLPIIITSTNVDHETILKISKFPMIKGILANPVNQEDLINILSK
ncbi:MAG: response regulator [Chryseobacterium sp.]|nr:MAG: response regulator [Chryseobacterium sp.]